MLGTDVGHSVPTPLGPSTYFFLYLFASDLLTFSDTCPASQAFHHFPGVCVYLYVGSCLPPRKVYSWKLCPRWGFPLPVFSVSPLNAWSVAAFISSLPQNSELTHLWAPDWVFLLHQLDIGNFPCGHKGELGEKGGSWGIYISFPIRLLENVTSLALREGCQPGST